MDIPKSLVKAIQNGQAPLEELTKHLSCQPMNEILTAFAELILISEDYMNRPQIAVSQEEYNQIMSLFRIKGLREINGVVCEERRGRPSKQKVYTEKKQPI